MTRKVRAILVEGDQPGSPGTPTPGATQAVDVIVEDLTSRFAAGGVEIERLRGAPTRQRLLAAFERMKALVRSDELFVVMFAGHGMEPDSAHRAQLWSLTRDEVFTDIELAKTLLTFPDGVDTVVINACCYGRGFFIAGPRLPRRNGGLVSSASRGPRGVRREHLQRNKLLSQTKILGAVLRTQWETAHKDSPMVCISAASKDDQVTLTKLMNLASETVAAARAERSYAQLSDAFATISVVGRMFHVDARPDARINDRVLST
jgi:hypothetical protein